MKPASTKLQAFYRAAQKQEEPKRADQRAVRATLLSAGVFSVAAHAGATTSALAALIPGGAKFLGLAQIAGYVALGAALGAGAAVVGAASTRAPATAASANAVSVLSARTACKSVPESDRALVTETANETALPSNPQRVLAPTPLPPSATALPSSPQHVLVPTPALPSTLSLTEESRALAEVQAALSVRDARKALQLLAAQDRQFAAGALGQERSAARVVALCAAGLTSDAQAARAAFLFKYPQSPLAKRVSSACEK